MFCVCVLILVVWWFRFLVLMLPSCVFVVSAGVVCLGCLRFGGLF